MLRTASLRLLRDEGSRLSSQAPPGGYSENLVPSIRRICSAPTQMLAENKVYSKSSYQDPREKSDCDGKSMYGIKSLREQFSERGPRKQHGTEDNNSVPWFSQKDPYHEKGLPGRAFGPYLFQIVLDTPWSTLSEVLDTWVEDNNHLEKNEVLKVLFHLRKQRHYNKALKFMEWIERRKLLNYEERDFACHLDLVVRNHGIEAAKKYIERVPKSFRNEVLYETLLGNCVYRTAVDKAEQIFKEMRDLSLPLTVFACNQMLLLYKRVAHTKVMDILLLMEKENIKPSQLTYRLLIDLKGRSNDILGMESVLDIMKDNGIEPNFATQTMVAKFYVSMGFTERAEKIVRAMEVYAEDKCAIRSLLDLYAVLGRPDDIARIWNSCTEPKLEDFLAAIEAWGKLGHIEQAEETFEALSNTSSKLSSKYYNAMLNVYAENKLLAKGKKFLERIYSSRWPSGPLTWDAIVKLYVNSGELEKADSFLQSVTEENPDRLPLFHSYMNLLKAYAEKGDIHNTEKIFDRAKEIRYPGKKLPYGFLLEAYVNAQVTPAGFIHRMRADNVAPTKTMMEKLKCLDNLQKGAEKI